MIRQFKLLPFDAWPESDRDLWAAAFRKGDLFDDGGPGAAWAEGSRRSVCYSYRRWLGFLAGEEPTALQLHPVYRATVDRVKRYVAALQSSISPAGTYNYAKHLYDALRVMAPDHDWTWLDRLACSLGRLVVPRSKRHRIVPAHDLVQLGFELMQKAITLNCVSITQRALLYRDGLIIALLASRPIRRRNLAMIRIDVHLRRDHVGYRLTFSDDETKSRTAIDFALPDSLTEPMDIYLHEWRLHIHGAGDHNGLWASAKGCPLSDSAIYMRVCTHTRDAFGRAINLHLFRDCVATTIAVENPGNVAIAAELLGHASLEMTERYYIQAGTMEASNTYQSEIQAARNRYRTQRRQNSRRSPPCV